MDLLSAGDGGSRSWHFLLWHQWVAALHAEAAVLAHDPGAARHLAEAKSGADRGRPHAMPLLAGMRLRERYQDWDRGPFTGESQDHIWVCEVTAALAG